MRIVPIGLFIGLMFCGLGGCHQEGALSPPPMVFAPLKGKHVFYYGSCEDCIAKTASHTTLQMVMGWGKPEYDIEGALRQIGDAKAAGQKVIIGIEPALLGHDAIRPILSAIVNSGYGDSLFGVYIKDEPASAGINEAAYCQAVNDVKSVAAEVKVSQPLTFMVINTNTSFIGISCVDWIGFDDYHLNERIFEEGGEYQQLVNKIQPWQKVVVIAGGVEPFLAPIEYYYNYLESDPRIAALVIFICFDNADKGLGKGVCNPANPRHAEYEAAAAAIKGNFR